MPKNYKSHKRQKSSLLNVGYYFQDQLPSHSPTRIPPHQLSQSTPSTVAGPPVDLTPASNQQLAHLLVKEELSSPMLSNLSQPMSSPAHSNAPLVNSPTMYLNLYELDVYNPLNYNFPPQERPLFYQMPNYQMEQMGSSFLPPPLNVPSTVPLASYQVPPTHLTLVTSSLGPQLGSSQMGILSQYSTPRKAVTASPRRRTHSRTLSLLTPLKELPLGQKPVITLPKHKANLSISSHFNLFSLSDPQEKQYLFNSTALLNELTLSLSEVDQPSVNNYLLKVLYKLDNPIPLDDFFNLLYNDQKLIKMSTDSKIDRTPIDTNLLQRCVEVLYHILEIFKKPDLIHEFLLHRRIQREVKLANINYHELLRTFLAIKILQDMLIELPRDNAEVTNFNIPRLSLYKTYYIICQKLLLKYPSSLSSNNEHHKLILGQSKLGKLIKLVYPNLLIKRLGSRGESKYNYLGVVWNENIIDDEINTLCSKYELTDLGLIFESKYKEKFEDILSQSGLKSESYTETSSTEVSRGQSNQPAPFQQAGLLQTSFEVEFSKPLYSFVNDKLKFPADFDVLVWVRTAKSQLKEDLSPSIHSIVDLLVNNTSQDVDFASELATKLAQVGYDLNQGNNDLKVYTLILFEAFPRLLLVEPSKNLKALKWNFKRYLDQETSELNSKNTVSFKLFLKCLMGLSDLLINLVKFVFKDAMILNDLHHVFDNTEHGNLVNNLIDSMILFNMSDSLNYPFLDEQTSNLKNFFLNDLFSFIQTVQMKLDRSNLSSINFDDSDSDFQLSGDEYSNLLQFLNLIKSGLINNFHQFPALMMINILNLVSNDFLKSVYFKHGNNPTSTSFGHWWSINCFLQDYVGLVGELYGLYNELYRIL